MEGRLCDVSGMDQVVVGVLKLAVALLEARQKVVERLSTDLWRVTVAISK